MSRDDDSAPHPIEDIRPSDYWGRHVLTKCVLFGALGAGIAGARFVEGDGGTLLMGVAGLVVWPIGMLASVDHMRGLVSPLSGRDLKLLSPIAGVAWAGAFIVASFLLVGTVALDVDDGERPGWLVATAAVAIGLMVLGVMIQIGSLSDQWPDKWRPPYARQQPPDASTGDPEPADPSRSDERP